MNVNPNISDVGLYWGEELGCQPTDIRQLGGGINNKVYKCVGNNATWIIKEYDLCLEGERDRMQAEIDFLKYSYEVAREFVPELIHVDNNRRCIILEYIEGKKIQEVTRSTRKYIVENASLFLKKLNHSKHIARDMIMFFAADGHDCLTDHMEDIKHRMGRMSCEHIEKRAVKKANKMLELLKEEAQKAEEQLMRVIASNTISNTLDKTLMIVSPSDFGLHNAIKSNSGLKFIDFEYAGWDDPAKTLTDFHLQPRIKIKDDSFPLLSIISKEYRDEIWLRCLALKPVLRVKWLCIILSVLDEQRLENLLLFEMGGSKEMLIMTRLEIAERYYREEYAEKDYGSESGYKDRIQKCRVKG